MTSAPRDASSPTTEAETTTATADGWLTAHLGFDAPLSGAVADRLLLDLVRPVIDRLLDERRIERYFFLRYNVPDHHLRVRLGAVTSESSRRHIKELFTEATAAFPEVRYLQWHPYTPEWERYGGPHGLPISEDLFRDASRSAFELLRKIPPGDRSSRLGKGLLTTLVLLHVFTGRRHDAAQLAQAYVRGYLQLRVPDDDGQEQTHRAFEQGFDRQAAQLAAYVEAAWQAMDDDEGLTPELDAYRRDMARHRDTLRQASDAEGLETDGAAHANWPIHVLHLVPSYLHMMNNRLGIEPAEEAYLASLIHRTLGAPPTSPQTADGADG